MARIGEPPQHCVGVYDAIESRTMELSSCCGVAPAQATPTSRTLKRLKPALFRQDLIALLDLLQQQEIKPFIAQRFPLVEARRAQELLGKGGVVGKIVLVRNGSRR
jgi:hypothetical protein